MKVWIVALCIPYEGAEDLIGVFATEALAKKAMEDAIAEKPATRPGWEVWEYDVQTA